MYYVIDEEKNQVDLETALDSLKSVKKISAVGMTLVLDGIECYGVYGTLNEVTFAGLTGYEGTGSAIFVDKNHDLSYYLAGSDYMNESESASVINTANKYGYEWGGLGVETGITATAVGTGLSNTNSLIEMNLQPNTSGWYVVWDKIKEFRQDHSNNWFLPSKDELNLIYEARNNLSGLTTINDASKNPYYRSSSEHSSLGAWIQRFNNGSPYGIVKYNHGYRSRLCRQY